MKTTLLLSAVTIGILSTPAFATVTRSVDLKAKLTYVDSSGKSKRMGGVSATLIQRGDQLVLRMHGKSLAVLSGKVSANDCADRIHNDVNAEAALPKTTVEALLNAATPALFRLKSTENQVAAAVAAAMAERPADYSLSLRAYYCSHDFIANDDSREETYSFTLKSGEKLKLNVKFDKHMDLDSDEREDGGSGHEIES